MGVVDEFDYEPGERYLDEEAEVRNEHDIDQALLGAYSGRLYSETRVDQELRETTSRGRAISARIRALTEDGWGAEQIDLVLSQVAAQERDRARHAAEEEIQQELDNPEAAQHLDEIMDAYHGLPDGTTHRLRQRAEREQKMTGVGADEYARTRADDRARQTGHGGWRPGKTVSVGFPMIHPLMLLDALAKAGLGLTMEPTRFPSEPPAGSVLKWVKTFKRNPEQGYTYTALHVNGAWYLSGKRQDPLTWDELVALIGDSPCELATNWVQIPQAPKGELDGLSPEEWYLATFPHDVIDGSDESGRAES